MRGEPKRRVLGKGLSSLIPDAPADPLAVGESAQPKAAGVATPLEVAVALVRPNPRQPRQTFDEQEIEALAQSVRNSGVLQPLLVRPEPDGTYTVIAGERRLRAARRAGLTTVPVMLRHVPDDKLLEFALIENLQREDLDPLETARAFRALVRDAGLTQAEVATRVNKPRSTIANYLRLLELPDEVQRLLSAREIDMGHARALAGLSDIDLQVRLASQAATGKWSVREIEERIRRASGGAAAQPSAPRDPNVAAAEKALARSLGAVVTIHGAHAGRGRIEIRFGGKEDLDRLYRLLLRATDHR
ncbi:MAG: ParB/RepB/Spo0J family partition protein [Acidobacteria bacterium]|nr:ParB/RepB/Spo0J family partition protein [Acidobacteriota bacterium]